MVESQTVEPGQPTSSSRRRPPHPVFWMIAGALGAIAVMTAVRPNGPALTSLAFGQTTNSGGARGMFAFSGQLDKGTHGVFMIDVDAMTIWAYEYDSTKNCLRLAASRTWRYDRYLENYNSCDLPPEAVEQMIDLQRQERLEKSEAQTP